MNAKNVLILSEELEDADRIEEIYASSESIDYKTNMVFKADEAVELLKNKDTDLLVFNLRDFSKKKLNAVLNLRQLGVKFPLLSISDTYDEDAYNFVRKLENSVMLNRPFKDSQLLTMSEKITNGVDVMQRRFPRFLTEENAYLSLYPNGSPTECSVKDISKGGACVIAPVDVGIKVGEIVRMKLFLEDVGKNHNFFGRVLWMDLIVDEGNYYIGIQFISEAQIFKSLLSNR
ncbi:MAG: PilZ domain-containing protein [Bdellovibrionota bacterium]|nr:hypothetical protein [Pseudobdellovibrionaceae bacterium]|tara:strand:+ start:22991 stop:23686 length:696 start_codon:yes stop_codon:yes gene_type:complete